MNKVIIITWSSEYSSDHDFKDAIDNRTNCNYNQRAKLKQFLAARKEWKAVKNKDGETTNRTAYRILLSKECPEDILSENIPYIAIQEKMETFSPDTSIAPYASFPSGQEWEVILVLCDKINIDRKECVDPIGLFLDCLCEDLEPFDTTDNVLYIHDKQIGDEGEEIIVDNHELRKSCHNTNKFYAWADANKHKFSRIAQFVHEKGKGGLFDGIILAKDFLGNDPYDE